MLARASLKLRETDYLTASETNRDAASKQEGVDRHFQSNDPFNLAVALNKPGKCERGNNDADHRGNDNQCLQCGYGETKPPIHGSL